MSHHLVINASQIQIDYEQSQSLMDNALAAQSVQWVADHANTLAKTGVSSQEQAIFDNYCRRHLEFYGEPFGPDMMVKPF